MNGPVFGAALSVVSHLMIWLFKAIVLTTPHVIALAILIAWPSTW